MSYIVALTGGIGSGKTTVANLFAEFNVPVIDADIIARQVVEPGTPALVKIAGQFGEKILNADGSLNRKALRAIIFEDSRQKEWLNSLIHPLVQKETLSLFASTKATYIIWVIPLLIENNLIHLADRVLVVDVDRETQINRIVSRDGSSRQQAEHILAAQVSREVRLSFADDVITNNSDISDITAQVKQLHEKYLCLAQQKSTAEQTPL